MTLSPVSRGSTDPTGGVERLHGDLARRPVKRNVPEGVSSPVGISCYEVAPGGRCTVHVHTGKVETWLFVAGSAVVTRGEESIVVSAGDAITTPPGMAHGFRVTGADPLILVNVVEFVDHAQVSTTEIGEPPL